MRKEFEVPPYSQSVELRSQIELRCHPPKGVPKPRVSSSIYLGNNLDNFRAKFFLTILLDFVILGKNKKSDTP